MTTAVADGTWQLRAVATDTAGYSAISTIVTTTVVNTATVTLGTIADVVRGSVPLSVTVTGNAGATVTTRFEYSVAGGDRLEHHHRLRQRHRRHPLLHLGHQRRRDVRRPRGRRDRQPDLLRHADRRAGRQRGPDHHPVACPAGTLTGAVDITAVADDVDSGVDTVTFEYKLSTAATWTTCGVDTDAPYSCHLVTSSWPNGSYSFRSTATDLAGNTTTTATVTRTVDNTAPSVSISAPSAGAVITTGSTTVTADAFAVAGVTSVRIEARTGAGTFAAICTDTSAPYSCAWSTAALASGTWDLRAVMTPPPAPR